jgi:hypothetical protein
MNKNKSSLKIGDSVKVKPGVIDPDLGTFSLEGWQGRILSIYQELGRTLVDIEWDSRTLREMPWESIEFSEKQGLSWKEMGLYLDDVEATNPIDTKADVEKAREDLLRIIDKNDGWVLLDDTEERIQEILSNVGDGDKMAAMRRWRDYFEQNLIFPYDAEVVECLKRGPLNLGDKVIVKRISSIDDHYGIIVEVRFGRKEYHTPLYDLEAFDTIGDNAPLTDYYRDWYSTLED